MELLLPPDTAILLAIDGNPDRTDADPKVFAASWWHGTAPPPAPGLSATATAGGRNDRGRPLLRFALCVKGGRGEPTLGRDLLDEIAEAFHNKTIKRRRRRLRRRPLRRTGPGHHDDHPGPQQRRVLPPHPAGQARRKIGTPPDIATKATKDNTWVDTLINRYGTTITARTTEIHRPLVRVWRTDPVRVILVKDSHRKANNKRSYDIAIVTTDMTATAAEIIARYAARWSIEVCFRDGKNTPHRETEPGQKGRRTERLLRIHGPDLSSSTRFIDSFTTYLGSRAACERPASGLRHDAHSGNTFRWWLGQRLEQRLAVLQPHPFEGVPLPAVTQQAGVRGGRFGGAGGGLRAGGADGLTRATRADRTRGGIPTQVVEVVEGVACGGRRRRIAEVRRSGGSHRCRAGLAGTVYQSVRRIIQGLDRGRVAMARGKPKYGEEARTGWMRRECGAPPMRPISTKLDIMVLDRTTRPAQPVAHGDPGRPLGYTVFLGDPTAAQLSLGLREDISAQA